MAVDELEEEHCAGLSDRQIADLVVQPTLILYTMAYTDG